MAGLMQNFQTAITAYAARGAAPAPAPAVAVTTQPTTRGHVGVEAEERAARSPFTDQHNPTVFGTACCIQSSRMRCAG